MRIVIESDNGKQEVSNDVLTINAGSAAPLITASICKEAPTTEESVVVDAGEPPSWLMAAIQGLVSSNQSSDKPFDGGIAFTEKQPFCLLKKVVSNGSGVAAHSQFDSAINAGEAPTV
jgi:hypothetical protein